MKDYYYILGVKRDATLEEIKKAHRKLSLKFHPDKNDGDEFFKDRFLEIQEAYETLIDNNKRGFLDFYLSGKQQKQTKPQFDKSVLPKIEYFKSNLTSFQGNEDIVLKWSTINANKVTIKQIGIVKSVGECVYSIADASVVILTFEIIAENTNISRKSKKTITIINKDKIDLIIKRSNYNQPKKTETPKRIITTKRKDSKIFQLVLFAVIFIVLRSCW